MNQREALDLVQRLLSDALAQKVSPNPFVRDLADRIGDLQATMRAALTVIEQVEREAER